MLVGGGKRGRPRAWWKSIKPTLSVVSGRVLLPWCCGCGGGEAFRRGCRASVRGLLKPAPGIACPEVSMIVVTGATGQLGSQIVERLLERVPAEQVSGSIRETPRARPYIPPLVRVHVAALLTARRLLNSAVESWNAGRNSRGQIPTGATSSCQSAGQARSGTRRVSRSQTRVTQGRRWDLLRCWA
jgi:hypothetical protein